MDTNYSELVNAVNEIRELLRLIAEPQIAARDQKLRDELSRLVGKSSPKAKAVLQMDGNHTQADLVKKTGMQKGNMSTLVKALSKANLLIGETKQPQLSISVPPTFFES